MIRLGLIGYPIDHSLSPKLHSAALQACNLDGDYSLFPIAPNDIRSIGSLLDRVRTGELTGLNVTIPHKQNAIRFLDGLTLCAKAIGAVNTVYLKEGSLIGDNTDAQGFLSDLDTFRKEWLTQIEGGHENTGKSALIIGAGGSARAVAYALERSGWTVTIAARHIEQALGFANHHLQVIRYDSLHLEDLLSTFQLIVNTTPVGMSPNTNSSIWIKDLPFPKDAALYDLIYNPRETLLFRQARNAGLQARTGMGMLVEQAALAFQIWTGHDIPRSIMFEAINHIEY
jgi:shikimate dehydrogenase